MSSFALCSHDQTDVHVKQVVRDTIHIRQVARLGRTLIELDWITIDIQQSDTQVQEVVAELYYTCQHTTKTGEVQT